MRVTFIHPDLGIGGAERLVVDAALALKSKGHSIKIFTSHHDSSHCFTETKDGTLDVSVIGDWMPRNLFGRFHVLFACLRMMYVAMYVMLNVPTDVVFCDQVSACIPVLKLMNVKILFYCHFPDLLLTERNSSLKSIYRYPFDWLEETTTGMADVILVNSEFTANVFYKTFKSLRNVKLEVVHPAITLVPKTETTAQCESSGETKYFLSLNRYERKKNVQLAIFAMSKLNEILPSDEKSKFRLIIAGGYDDRVLENKEYLRELQCFSESVNLRESTTFLKSPSDSEKQKLICSATAVLYTPENEHFGIVPLESMYLCTPVVACNSGGPLETIEDGFTGFLCEPSPDAFAKKMELLASDESLVKKMGLAGKQRVLDHFSSSAFGGKLDAILRNLSDV